MSERLTKPQLDLLTHAVAAGKATTAQSYPPAANLVRRGFAKWVRGKYSDWLEPTDAGRAALAVSERDGGRP